MRRSNAVQKEEARGKVREGILSATEGRDIPVDMVIPLRKLEKTIIKDYDRFMDETSDMQSELHKKLANGLVSKGTGATPRLGFIVPARSIRVTFDTIGRKHKYIRVSLNNWTQSAVWGFIVCSEEDENFAYGTVLQAGSWEAPTRTYSRGNIFEADYLKKVRWARAI